MGPGGLDAAIRCGSGGWLGLVATKLAGETVFPACSPAYARDHEIAGAQDLERGRLLHNGWQDWSPWFQQAGLVLSELKQGMTYDDAG